MRIFILFIPIFIVSTLISYGNHHPAIDDAVTYGFPFFFLSYSKSFNEDFTRGVTDIELLSLGLDLAFSLVIAVIMNLGIKKFGKKQIT